MHIFELKMTPSVFLRDSDELRQQDASIPHRQGAGRPAAARSGPVTVSARPVPAPGPDGSG